MRFFCCCSIVGTLTIFWKMIYAENVKSMWEREGFQLGMQWNRYNAQISCRPPHRTYTALYMNQIHNVHHVLFCHVIWDLWHVMHKTLVSDTLINAFLPQEMCAREKMRMKKKRKCRIVFLIISAFDSLLKICSVLLDASIAFQKTFINHNALFVG